ncbi:hypothetical protein CDAR_555661 [Caerostris darwini]|uniref:Uncharacterized protein n=1 Tax=Caerostris darwini TaxID=1538125 RepID=A0AAV4QWM2_9ARAC|nr:hypothetical protein CDAR_555661 [Caerostris darwini]
MALLCPSYTSPTIGYVHDIITKQASFLYGVVNAILKRTAISVEISRHPIQLFHPLKLGRFLIPSFGIAFLLRYHRPILHAAWRIPALTTNKLPTVAIFRFLFREILNGAWITNGPHPKPYQFSSMPHFGGSCPVAILEDYPEER